MPATAQPGSRLLRLMPTRRARFVAETRTPRSHNGKFFSRKLWFGAGCPTQADFACVGLFRPCLIRVIHAKSAVAFPPCLGGENQYFPIWHQPITLVTCKPGNPLPLSFLLLTLEIGEPRTTAKFPYIFAPAGIMLWSVCGFVLSLLLTAYC